MKSTAEVKVWLVTKSVTIFGHALYESNVLQKDWIGLPPIYIYIYISVEFIFMIFEDSSFLLWFGQNRPLGRTTDALPYLSSMRGRREGGRERERDVWV